MSAPSFDHLFQSPPPPRAKGYKTESDISIAGIVGRLKKLKYTDPAEYARRRRIQSAYDAGDIDLAIVMEEQGVTERQARRVLTEDAKWRALRDSDPAEHAFQLGIWREWKRHLKRRLRDGEISYDEIQSATAPPRHIEVTPTQWARLQALARDEAPWRTDGQKAAYDRGFRERQRADAVQVFSSLGPRRRADHWQSWWRHESPKGTWFTAGAEAWTIWRKELERQIARDAGAQI